MTFSTFNVLACVVILASVSQPGLCATSTKPKLSSTIAGISLAEANTLVELPLSCVKTEYPNKLNQVIGGDADLKPPSQLHPIFYGCFDWHSAVHGYWSMVSLLKQYPNLDKADEVKAILRNTITAVAVSKELEYFEAEINKSWERTYGWAWLLKLVEEIDNWDTPLAKQLSANLKPLADKITKNYIEFLPKLVYPIRVGEHTNTAFGLTFAHDYAVASKDQELKSMIEQRARDFYFKDAACPINWEPSGYDFLSPCLEEVDLMRRVLKRDEYLPWLKKFMPELSNESYTLQVGKVGDRTDGKLVHLDGLNFSRAWVLFALANEYPRYSHLRKIADQHIRYSYPNLIGDSYEGGHWLGSFAIYALNASK